MPMTEWNWNDALAVRHGEGMEEGRKEGLEEGIWGGVEKTARNALAEGASIEFVQKITGLDLDTITRLNDGA